MLCLTYDVGEAVTLLLPDGQQVHVLVQKITERKVRLIFAAPDTVRITRDSVGAARTFKELKL